MSRRFLSVDFYTNSAVSYPSLGGNMEHCSLRLPGDSILTGYKTILVPEAFTYCDYPMSSSESDRYKDIIPIVSTVMQSCDKFFDAFRLDLITAFTIKSVKIHFIPSVNAVVSYNGLSFRLKDDFFLKRKSWHRLLVNVAAFFGKHILMIRSLGVRFNEKYTNKKKLEKVKGIVSTSIGPNEWTKFARDFPELVLVHNHMHAPIFKPKIYSREIPREFNADVIAMPPEIGPNDIRPDKRMNPYHENPLKKMLIRMKTKLKKVNTTIWEDSKRLFNIMNSSLKYVEEFIAKRSSARVERQNTKRYFRKKVAPLINGFEGSVKDSLIQRYLLDKKYKRQYYLFRGIYDDDERTLSYLKNKSKYTDEYMSSTKMVLHPSYYIQKRKDDLRLESRQMKKIKKMEKKMKCLNKKFPQKKLWYERARYIRGKAKHDNLFSYSKTKISTLDLRKDFKTESFQPYRGLKIKAFFDWHEARDFKTALSKLTNRDVDFMVDAIEYHRSINKKDIDYQWPFRKDVDVKTCSTMYRNFRQLSFLFPEESTCNVKKSGLPYYENFRRKNNKKIYYLSDYKSMQELRDFRNKISIKNKFKNLIISMYKKAELKKSLDELLNLQKIGATKFRPSLTQQPQTPTFSTRSNIPPKGQVESAVSHSASKIDIRPTGQVGPPVLQTTSKFDIRPTGQVDPPVQITSKFNIRPTGQVDPPVQITSKFNIRPTGQVDPTVLQTTSKTDNRPTGQVESGPSQSTSKIDIEGKKKYEDMTGQEFSDIIKPELDSYMFDCVKGYQKSLAENIKDYNSYNALIAYSIFYRNHGPFTINREVEIKGRKLFIGSLFKDRIKTPSYQGFVEKLFQIKDRDYPGWSPKRWI